MPINKQKPHHRNPIRQLGVLTSSMSQPHIRCASSKGIEQDPWSSVKTEPWMEPKVSVTNCWESSYFDSSDSANSLRSFNLASRWADIGRGMILTRGFPPSVKRAIAPTAHNKRELD